MGKGKGKNIYEKRKEGKRVDEKTYELRRSRGEKRA